MRFELLANLAKSERRVRGHRRFVFRLRRGDVFKFRELVRVPGRSLGPHLGQV